MAKGLSLSLVVILLAACSSPRAVWIRQQDVRCLAMGGTGYYAVVTGEYECWRHPIMRFPRKMFSTKYTGPDV